MEEIDANRTIAELTTAHPELIEILAEAGLSEIRNPFQRQTVGKIVSLKQGIKIRKIESSLLVQKLFQAGFILKGLEEDTSKQTQK